VLTKKASHRLCQPSKYEDILKLEYTGKLQKWPRKEALTQRKHYKE